MKVVGLQTHIWSNNSKSLILLFMFPVIIGILLFSVIFAFVFISGNAYEEKEYCYTSNISKKQVCEIREIESTTTFDEMLITSTNLFVSLLPTFLGVIGVWFFIAWIINKGLVSSLTGAKPIDRKSSPELYNIVENLCISRGLNVPQIYIIEDDSMNAFAYGLTPKNSYIAFSRGILNNLNKDEIEAVAAHELTHIINQDTRLMIIAIIFVGIIQTIAEIIIRIRMDGGSNDKDSGKAIIVILGVKILAFLLGFLFTIVIQSLISQKREYLADAGAVELTKSSEHLINALKKISGDSQIEAVSTHNVAQMFIYNPLSSKNKNFFYSLFATHPPMEDRIKALEMIG